jgi:hypothetical protein
VYTLTLSDPENIPVQTRPLKRTEKEKRGGRKKKKKCGGGGIGDTKGKEKGITGVKGEE